MLLQVKSLPFSGAIEGNYVIHISSLSVSIEP
jgi:hypothetical protein